MTGIYFRAKRNDKWENIELEHLTKEEQKKYLDSFSYDANIKTFKLLVDTLNPNKEEIIGLNMLLCDYIKRFELEGVENEKSK